MRMRISAALACLAVGLVGLASTANAAPISWNIVSSASTIALAIPNQTITVTSTANIVLATSQTVSIRALNPSTLSNSTPTGWTIGNKENVSGVLQTDTDFLTNVRFLTNLNQVSIFNAPTVINGIDSGSYQPLSEGSPGSASGDFGTRIYAGAGALVGQLNVDMAIRDVLYQLTSGTLAVTAGSFTHGGASQFGLEDSSIAYRGRNGSGLGGATFVGLIGSGSADTGALATTNTTGSKGTISILGNLATITIPITQTLEVPLDEDGLLVFKLGVTGTIVATAIIPEPATYALLGVGMAMLAPMAVRRWRKRS